MMISLEPKNEAFINFMNLSKIPLYLLVSILLGGLVFYIDYQTFTGFFFKDEVQILQEVINSIIFVLFYLHLSKFYKYSNYTVTEAINKIYLCFVYIAVIYLALYSANSFRRFEFDVSEDLYIRTSLHTIFSTSILTYVISYFFIKILFLLKVLIFYKRKRNTAVLYNTFNLLLLLAVISTYISPDNIKFNFDKMMEYSDLQTALFFKIIFALFIGNILFLVTRTAWITYLSRKNKYMYFLGMVVTLIFLHYIYDDYITLKHQNLLSHSQFLGFGAFYFGVFLKIYFWGSMLNLLLHLPTARVFDQKIREVNSLYKLSSAINSESDFNKLVLMVTNMTNEVTEANSTWLEMYDEEKERLYIASSKKLTSYEIKTALMEKDKGLSGRVFSTKKSMNIQDVSKSKEFSYLKAWKGDVHSIAAVPLITTKNKILGVLFVTKNYVFGFDPDDVTLLESFANQVVIAMENSELIKESVHKERLEQELKIARDVQLKLLPQNIPSITGVDADAIAFTASEVGGDYFDFVQKDNHLTVVVADVSGKGTSAAFYMAELKGIIKSLATIYSSPKELFSHTNGILYEQLEKKSFITGCLINIDTKKKTATFVRAGHNPLLYYNSKDDEISFFTPKGLGLGISSNTLFDSLLEEQKLKFQPGDIVVLYTDGLSEARNIFEEEYSDERIGEILYQNKDKTSSEIKDSIIDDVISFSGKAKMHDDMTLAIIKIE